MADRAFAGFGEAPFVRVLVTCVAVPPRRLGCRCGVAGGTRLLVRPFESKSGFVVVVVIDRLPIDLGAVAERAFLLPKQRLTVHVLVARRAVRCPVGETEHRAWVTAIAGHPSVLGFDGEASVLVVIELRRVQSAPVFGIVAALAVGDLFVKLTVW